MEEDNLFTRIKRGWNAFRNQDIKYYNHGQSSSYRPDRFRMNRGNERSLVNSIINRIAVDAASIEMIHVRVDEDGQYQETIKSSLNTRLTLDANLDQTGRAFIQDVVTSMLDDGSVAIVPVDTNIDPILSNSFTIESMRVGKILEWFPMDIRARVYDERSGKLKDILVPKRTTAIIENPFYSVMNEPNSTLQRLVRKLNILDVIDEQSGSGKLDIIIQVPYVIKGTTKTEQSERRRSEIEAQLHDSKYGIAYVDATEKVIQLNRPVENNLMAQIKFLTEMLYSQLGMTLGILDGSATSETLLNYQNRIIEPVLASIKDEIIRKFLSKTARSQGQTIMIFQDPFKMIPIDKLADIADTFTRNEITSSNEIRGKLGMKPSKAPGANDLRNKNLNPPTGSEPAVDNTKSNSNDSKTKEVDKNGRL